MLAENFIAKITKMSDILSFHCMFLIILKSSIATLPNTCSRYSSKDIAFDSVTSVDSCRMSQGRDAPVVINVRRNEGRFKDMCWVGMKEGCTMRTLYNTKATCLYRWCKDPLSARCNVMMEFVIGNLSDQSFAIRRCEFYNCSSDIYGEFQQGTEEVRRQLSVRRFEPINPEKKSLDEDEFLEEENIYIRPIEEQMSLDQLSDENNSSSFWWLNLNNIQVALWCLIFCLLIIAAIMLMFTTGLIKKEIKSRRKNRNRPEYFAEQESKKQILKNRSMGLKKSS